MRFLSRKKHAVPVQARRTSAARRHAVGSTPLREAPAQHHRTPETGASGTDAIRVSPKRIRHPVPYLPSPHRSPAGPRPPLPPPAAGAAPCRSGTEGDRLSSLGGTDVTHGTPLEERLQATKKKKRAEGRAWRCTRTGDAASRRSSRAGDKSQRHRPPAGSLSTCFKRLQCLWYHNPLISKTELEQHTAIIPCCYGRRRVLCLRPFAGPAPATPKSPFTTKSLQPHVSP